MCLPVKPALQIQPILGSQLEAPELQEQTLAHSRPHFPEPQAKQMVKILHDFLFKIKLLKLYYFKNVSVFSQMVVSSLF